MAEKGPADAEAQEKAKAEFESMQKELGPLVQKLQELMQNPEASPEEKVALIKRILEILEKFKQMMGEDAFYENEQLVQLENFVKQAQGSLEG